MGAVTKIVIDTNVFISAFGWDGKPEIILRLMEQGKIENQISAEIFEELKRVVAYPKLKFSRSLQAKILEFVFSWSKFVEPVEQITIIADDPDDDKFIACAVSAGAAYLVSGDPHLLNLGRHHDLRFVSPTDFLEIFR